IEAAQMDRAVAFYRDVLGFEEVSVSPYWSELSHGGAILGIHGGGDELPKPTGLSIQYEDVSFAYDSAISAGATGLMNPEQREGEPIMLASIRDPEGNEIMLTQFAG
ncbi:MAG: VOC family protein, partial [Verrucomicrobiota bacterium]